MYEKQTEAEYHRRILGVIPPFDLARLRTGYLRLIKEHHPDRFFGDHTKYASATEKTKQLNFSFQYLSEYLEEIGGNYVVVISSQADNTRQNVRRPPATPRYTYEGESYTTGFPDASITEIFLKSSHIISTGYDRMTRQLYIKFKGSRVYRYYEVPNEIVEAFLAAESHGKFAHQNIYHAFRYEQL